MNTTAHRVVRRYLHGDAFINLTPIPMVVADGGVVSASDLERLLGHHGIEAHDVAIHRLDGDAPNVFRWSGRGAARERVQSQLVLHIDHDRKHVVVSSEVALAAVTAEDE